MGVDMKSNNYKRQLLLMLFTWVAVFFNSNVWASQWKLEFGVGLLPGISDIVDLHKDNLRQEGNSVSEVGSSLPFGYFIQSHLQFDNGFGVGGGLGPIMLIVGTSDILFVNLPVEFDVSYAYVPASGNLSPYARIGLRKNFASGDYVEASKAGPFGAVGVEFLRKSKVNFAIEVAVDRSKIEFQDLAHNDTKSLAISDVMLNFFFVVKF